MSDLGSKPMEFPKGSSGNGMVDGADHVFTGNLDDYKCEGFTSVHDPVIQAGVDSVWEILMDTQAVSEAILTMTENQIVHLRVRLYEEREDWKEEYV